MDVTPISYDMGYSLSPRPRLRKRGNTDTVPQIHRFRMISHGFKTVKIRGRPDAASFLWIPCVASAQLTLWLRDDGVVVRA